MKTRSEILFDDNHTSTFYIHLLDEHEQIFHGHINAATIYVFNHFGSLSNTFLINQIHQQRIANFRIITSSRFNGKHCRVTHLEWKSSPIVSFRKLSLVHTRAPITTTPMSGERLVKLVGYRITPRRCQNGYWRDQSRLVQELWLI